MRLQHHWREFDATSSRTLVILIVLDALKNHNFVGVVQAELEKGQWLGIVGSGGGVDRLGLQFAKAIGLKVVGVDARQDGLALTRQLRPSAWSMQEERRETS